MDGWVDVLEFGYPMWYPICYQSWYQNKQREQATSWYQSWYQNKQLKLGIGGSK